MSRSVVQRARDLRATYQSLAIAKIVSVEDAEFCRWMGLLLDEGIERLEAQDQDRAD